MESKSAGVDTVCEDIEPSASIGLEFAIKYLAADNADEADKIDLYDLLHLLNLRLINMLLSLRKTSGGCPDLVFQARS